MLYRFEMTTVRGTSYAIIKNPKFSNGVITATQVGELDGFADDGSLAFKKCDEREFIAGGGPYTLTEVKE